jgi:squalene-associated FAD-dependent desaturase
VGALKVAVVGGGWAGLAAAVEATRGGHAVSLFEMSATLGGRARRVQAGGRDFDNGQHIIIGAYSATLASMRAVGVDVDAVLRRVPLQVRYPDGSGLTMTAGAPVPAFLKAVVAYRGWRWRDRLGLLTAAAGWTLARFHCDPSWTVERLTRGLPAIVRGDFIDPLCVAALNTPSHLASASVFLRVLKDALFSGTGSADLLLPRVGLDALFPTPAANWLVRHGARVQAGRRVDSIAASGASGWLVDGEPFDAVVLACTATEAARLALPTAVSWATTASTLHYEPIVTVWVRADGLSLPSPMLALRSDSENPAQFVFDHGALSGRPGLMALVVSGAGRWLEAGMPSLARAALAQARRDLTHASIGTSALRATPGSTSDWMVVQTIAEKRATFLCTPALMRPGAAIAPGLHAAGDYVDGPYPATLEGAVRSGVEASRRLGKA